MRKFRKKPVEVSVLTFDEVKALFGTDNLVDGDVAKLSTDGGRHLLLFSGGVVSVPTEEGVMQMTGDDVMIIGVKGEVYPCKKDIFAMTYDEVV